MTPLEYVTAGLFVAFTAAEVAGVTEMGVTLVRRGASADFKRIVRPDDFRMALSLVLGAQLVGALIAWDLPATDEVFLVAAVGSLGGGYLLHKVRGRWAQVVIFAAVVALGALAGYTGLG